MVAAEKEKSAAKVVSFVMSVSLIE